MWHSSRDGTRAVLTAGGLVLLVGLIGALAYEAVTAARAQRETVEGVLRDYAEIAAEQYAGGVSRALDYSWFFPVVRQLSTNAGTLQAPAMGTEIRTQTGAYEVDSLVTLFFAGTPGTDEWAGAAGWPAPRPDAGLRQLIGERAAVAVQEGWPFAISMLPGEEPDRVLVIRATRDPDTGRVRVEGFRAPLTGFEAVLDRALDPARVLPGSFIDPSGGELVALRLIGDDDRILYERGPAFDPAFSAAAELGPRLGGLRVQAAIPASSARDLVIGGLPRSRLPAIGLMLAVAVALLVGGVLVIRQERELVRLRERFVAGASHELRTPLAQIRMFAETLRLDRVRSPQERDRSLEILDREAQRLSYLVENLLVFSRPESQRKRAAGERIELGALVADVLDGFTPLARDRGASLELTGPGGVLVEIDRDRMRQVLLNLLDNATKYGPEGQTVVVSVARDGEGRAVLSVEDEGPGIPAGERSLVWARFWRGTAVDDTTGTGIGLSIVKELVELGDGEVTVTDAPGGGARFRIVLPEAG